MSESCTNSCHRGKPGNKWPLMGDLRWTRFLSSLEHPPLLCHHCNWIFGLLLHKLLHNKPHNIFSVEKSRQRTEKQRQHFGLQESDMIFFSGFLKEFRYHGLKLRRENCQVVFASRMQHGNSLSMLFIISTIFKICRMIDEFYFPCKFCNIYTINNHSFLTTCWRTKIFCLVDQWTEILSVS